jgi:NitT/TauT family transport system permease protein
MAQVFVRNPRQETRTSPRFREAWWIDALVFVAFIGLAYGLVGAASRWARPLTPGESIDLSPWSLPRYAGLSTMRMAIAYILSLSFSIAYARLAVSSPRAERVMIPILDILQSVPILSFLPGVVLALVALFPHSVIGLELAAIVLIFTSQAWNLAFSFHQSLTTIPKDLSDAATVYRLNFWQRFSRLELPFGTIPLIWNSMMSWAGGWFFLMAAEQLTLGKQSFQLPGLGSYLQVAANAGNTGALLLGLSTLVIVIVLLDQLLWRPLIAWSDRFKVESTASATTPKSLVLRQLGRSGLLYWVGRHIANPLAQRLDDALSRPDRSSTAETSSVVGARTERSAIRRAGGWLVLLLLAGAAVVAVVDALRLFVQVTPEQWGDIIVAAGATLLRTTLALLIAVLWTVPVGVAIGLSPKWSQRLQPLVQIFASIPALAIFPALLALFLKLPGGLNIASVALMLLGTQWYVLFNVIAGAMAIPEDLREAAVIYKLRGWRRWRFLILPAIFPFLVTGMITATGGAWNASIVSEYVTFGGHTYTTVGLGATIAGSAGNGAYPVLLAATVTMAAVVVTVNRLFWRRLYRVAEQRYHLD